MTVNFSGYSNYKDFFKKAGISNPAQDFAPAAVPVAAQQQNTLASVRVGDVETEKDKNNKKLFGIIGISVGSVLLLGIIGLFTLSKGFSGNIARKLTKVSESAKRKIYDLSVQSKELTTSQKMQVRLNKNIEHCADALQATSNISAVKDSLMYHWIKKLHLGKFADSVNNFFKNKLVLKTKNNAYKSAEYAAIDFCNYLEKIAREKNDPELAKKAQQIMSEFMENFSAQKHTARTEKAWESMAGLHDEVYNALFKKEGGFFKNLKQLRSYVTTDLIAKERNSVFKKVNVSKSHITNSLSDVNTAIKQALADLKISINPENKKALEIVKDITKIIESNKSLSGKGEESARRILFEKIRANLDELLEITKKDLKNPADFGAAKNRIEKFREVLSENYYKKGLAQEVITDVKNLFAKEGGRDSLAYKQAVKYMEKMNSRLNTAINHENTAYEKLAELRVGSAPTDLLGILGPTALGTLLVVNSKDTDERISKTLTQGIPILGGVATTYYGTIRGFTGAKNLILGLTTGYLLNVIGSKTDELVKKYRTEQTKLKKAFESFTKLQKTQNQDKQTTTAG